MRQRNEDHYLVVRLGRYQETLATSLSGSDVPPRFEESGYAMLVADGLGEGGAGSVASRVALSTIAHLALHYGKWNLRVDPATATQIFERAEWFYSQADAAVHTRASSSPALKGMTTALTAAYSAGDRTVRGARRPLARLPVSRREADAADARSHHRAAPGRHQAGRRRSNAAPRTCVTS